MIRGHGVLRFLRHAGAVVAAGLGAGFTCLGAVLAPRSIVGAALVGVLAGLVGFAVVVGRAETSADQQQLHRRAMHAAGACGGGMALAVLALVGMATVLGAATAPVLLLCIVAVAPWVWARLSPQGAFGPPGRHPDPEPASAPRQTGRIASPYPQQVPGQVPGPESLSTLGLCGQWQRSYFALAKATDTVERDRIAALRRGYLDELERRDPDAVARWLAADTRPAGTSPARHLSPVGAGALSPTDRPAPSPGPDPLPGAQP